MLENIQGLYKESNMRGGDESRSLARLITFLLRTWKGSTFLGTPLNLPDIPSLCTPYGQVKKRIQVKDLHKKAIIEWLDTNNYYSQAEKLEVCGTSFIHLKCSNEHEKYVRAHCDHEYCPACGKRGSHTHKRRTMRAIDRLMWAPILGYLVFTLPKEVSEGRLDKDRLRELRKAVYGLIGRYFTSPGGLARYHLIGDTPGTFHTHLNVLFPITGAQVKGKVDKEVLDKLRDDYTKEVNRIFGLKVPVTNIHYSFAYKKPKMYHRIKYVLRPIVNDINFLVMSDEDKHQVLMLEGWHNTVWYGELANSRYKEFLNQMQDERDFEEPIEQRNHGNCPICNQKYRFVDIVPWSQLPHQTLRYVDENTFVDFPTFSFLRDKNPP